MKDSILVKLMIILTLMPNLVIPVMNYQFNYAVNEQFATEGGLLQFFGYFRGVLNVISLFILLFVGRIYGRWGLPVALMFHPINYLFAFTAFLFRFDVFSAIYARMSTNILRTTINIPAQAVIMGLFPESYRPLVRPFLRGTVVRIGLFIGSGLILLSTPLFHPRYLSIVCAPFVIVWIIAPFILKKRYAGILLDLISKKILDLKSMENKDIGSLFNEKEIRQQLMRSFISASGENAAWFAKLLKTLSVENLDNTLLNKIQEESDETKIALIPFLSKKIDRSGIKNLENLLDPAKPELAVALLQGAKNWDHPAARDLIKLIFDSYGDLQVKASAAGILFKENSSEYRRIIDVWLDSKDMEMRKAGLTAAAESAEPEYIGRFVAMIREKENEGLLFHILEGLSRFEASDLNPLVQPYLSHPDEMVRKAALNIYRITDDDSLKSAILMLGDLSEEINILAKKKIEESAYQNNLLLISCLVIPRRRIREGLFELLEILQIKDIDVIRFARSQIEGGYNVLAEAHALSQLPESPKRDILIQVLEQDKKVRVENTLRVLALQDRTGQMKIIVRGIFSSDSRQRANSQEALDDLLDSSISKVLIPILEDLPYSQHVSLGRKHFNLPDFGPDGAGIIPHLLTKPDWVTVILTLYLVSENLNMTPDSKIMAGLLKSENPHIRQMASIAAHYQDMDHLKKEGRMEKSITISDKILHLKGIEIFEDLSVNELAAIASVTDEISSLSESVVIKEGEPGDTMYMVIEGEVSVIRGFGSKDEIELERIRNGDYFGEMALLDDIVRSATIRTEKESRFL
ncbi:MAG: cyclic nucleotide-binding domain-containing protein, partial [Thermodesulfobacteriota bacterium]